MGNENAAGSGTRLSAARIDAAAASLKAELDSSLVAPGRIHLFWQTIAAHALAAADVVEASECYLREDDAVSDHDLSEGVVCARCYGALADTISAEASEVARLREELEQQYVARVAAAQMHGHEVARLRTALTNLAGSVKEMLTECGPEFSMPPTLEMLRVLTADLAVCERALAESVPSPPRRGDE